MLVPVSEIFGPTIQGEGLRIGTRTYFLRTYGCDNSCQWCDTPYARTNDWYQILTPEDILGRFDHTLCSTVTLTGGNPCIHNLTGLVRQLRQAKFTICVETQGTVRPSWLSEVHLITLSPKPPSSGNLTTMNSDALEEIYVLREDLPLGVEFKVVVYDEQDYVYAKTLYLRYPQAPLTLQIGDPRLRKGRKGKPERGEREEEAVETMYSLEGLIDRVMQDKTWSGADVRVLPQLHKLIWGNRRGV